VDANAAVAGVEALLSEARVRHRLGRLAVALDRTAGRVKGTALVEGRTPAVVLAGDGPLGRIARVRIRYLPAVGGAVAACVRVRHDGPGRVFRFILTNREHSALLEAIAGGAGLSVVWADPAASGARLADPAVYVSALPLSAETLRVLREHLNVFRSPG
jgi:hypothetical protein